MYLTPLYLSLFHINDTYHLSSQFLLYIFPLLSTTSHHLSILLPLVVSWLLRSSPPLDDSLPPGHVAPFLRAFSTEEAWCTLSSASLSLVTHDLFSFYPYLDRAQSEYPYPAPGASFSRRWSFSRLLSAAIPLPRYSPSSLPTISHISLSLSLHALPTSTTPLRTYANAAAVIGTATRARTATRIFSRENVCVRMGERARAATHTKGTRWASPDHAICARTRAILPSFEPRETVYRSCAVQRELRKGGGVLRVNSIPRVALQVPFDSRAWLVLPFLS